MGGVLSHKEARAFYDRFGAKQDLQSFYEDPAVERLIAHADFANASAVLVSLTFGETPVSRLLCRAWIGLHSARPQLVGGCRPLHLQPFLKASWELIHHEVVCTLGVCSEVLVTSPLEPSMG